MIYIRTQPNKIPPSTPVNLSTRSHAHCIHCILNLDMNSNSITIAIHQNCCLDCDGSQWCGDYTSMSHVRYMIEGSDTGYIPRGDQLYLAITRGPSAARAESDGQVQLVT